MENTNFEITGIEKSSPFSIDSEIRDLNDLQLAYVGGGIAELVGV